MRLRAEAAVTPSAAVHGFRSWWTCGGAGIALGKRDRGTLCACVPCAHPSRVRVGRPGVWRGSGGLEGGDPRRRGDVERVEDLALRVAERRGLLNGAVGPGEGDE